MLNHTKKIIELYEDIQKKIFYMIPENWERFYLYCSIIDNPKNHARILSNFVAVTDVE